MTRQELLRIVIRQARTNGFQFRKWYLAAIDPSWNSFDDAVDLLAQGRRYYSLLFAHEFARAFWKQGSQISFVVPGHLHPPGQGRPDRNRDPQTLHPAHPQSRRLEVSPARNGGA